ncbi:MAG: hypothetical protein KGL39_42025 [Patescibacteria group bacterium]|nr:hypothetical protein [Patescibacteria group bacterium]
MPDIEYYILSIPKEPSDRPLCWWHRNGIGVTTHLDLAKKFTSAEIQFLRLDCDYYVTVRVPFAEALSVRVVPADCLNAILNTQVVKET